MKKGIKSFISLLLAASVLISSTGVVIASHVCLKKGQADVSFFQSKSCCSKHHSSCSPVPVVKKKCCQLSVSYHKLELNSIVKVASASHGISIPVLDAVVTPQTSSAFLNTFQLTDDPPGNLKQIPGSKTFLHSIHLLLI